MPQEMYFHCNTRDMLVSSDLMDCSGCPMKNWPKPCQQFHERVAALKRGSLEYKFESLEPNLKSDITE